MARAGEGDEPVRPAPSALRPFLRFARVPPRALTATRRVLDEDADFRRRVADDTGEAEVGRPGWLFLHRPEGWETELEALAAAASKAQEARVERQAEASAERRAEAAVAAAARAAEALASSRADAERLAVTRAAERQARRVAEEERDALRLALEAERDARAAAETAGAAARTELVSMAQEVDELRAALAATESQAPESQPRLDEGGEDERRWAEARADVGPRLDVVSRLNDAARTLAGMAAAFESAAEELLSATPPDDRRPPVELDGSEATSGQSGERSEVVVLREPAGPSVPPGAAAPATAAAGLAVNRRRSVPRTPLRLPPGLHDDSVEAATHLLRSPSVVVLVDGYNVSQEGWYGLTPAEQRRRLLDTLAEIAVRTTARIEVVFDGADEKLPQGVVSTPRGVRATFSPPGVEADQVLAERAATLPSSQPVIVVSSDNWVRNAASRAGANVVSSRQFLGAAGRRGGTVPPVVPPR